jgi:hypothetical protein
MSDEIQFSTIFRSAAGRVLAATWFDEDCRLWAISTIPLARFPSEREAVDYYWARCDPETGMTRFRCSPAGSARHGAGHL